MASQSQQVAKLEVVVGWPGELHPNCYCLEGHCGRPTMSSPWLVGAKQVCLQSNHDKRCRNMARGAIAASSRGAVSRRFKDVGVESRGTQRGGLWFFSAISKRFILA